MNNSSKIQLPTLCVRSLNDKLFEKKKNACREIELMTKEFNSAGNKHLISELIELLERDFINNPSLNSKVGGLIAISSVAIALDRDAKLYISEIITPILASTHDTQREVRYRALEALYNVVKCVRGDVLIYLDKIFDVIIFMCEDSDHNSREASMLMDKLVKDIIIENPSFDIVNFIQVIRERIYAVTSNTRKLILSWISFLDSVPDIDLLVFINELLDGLLKIACDSNLDIRRASEGILDEFYKKILNNHEQVDFKLLIKIVLIHVHVQAESDLVQNISLKWLYQCIKLAKSSDILHNSAHILAIILPCLSQTRSDNEKRDTDKALHKDNIELAKNINQMLITLITTLSSEDLVFKNDKPETNDGLNSFGSNSEEPFDITKIVIVLVNELELGKKTSTQTRIAILEWIFQIYDNLDIELNDDLKSKLLNILFGTLPDTSETVIIMALKVLVKIIFKDSNESVESKNFKNMLNPLVEMFYKDTDKDKVSLVICELCNIRDEEKVLTTISEILLNYDPEFIRSMVYILNTILLTAKELMQTRNRLKKVNISDESYNLFHILYKTWCFSPVSAISLCLYTKCYKLASQLILHLGDVDINIDILVEIDQLIKLVESPIFTSLRLDLLNFDNNYYLSKCLYGLLMLLPQTEAFHLLRKRLRCLPDHVYEKKENGATSNDDRMSKENDFDQMLSYYFQVQITNSKVKSTTK